MEHDAVRGMGEGDARAIGGDRSRVELHAHVHGAAHGVHQAAVDGGVAAVHHQVSAAGAGGHGEPKHIPVHGERAGVEHVAWSAGAHGQVEAELAGGVHRTSVLREDARLCAIVAEGEHTEGVHRAASKGVGAPELQHKPVGGEGACTLLHLRPVRHDQAVVHGQGSLDHQLGPVHHVQAVGREDRCAGDLGRGLGTGIKCRIDGDILAAQGPVGPVAGVVPVAVERAGPVLGRGGIRDQDEQQGGQDGCSHGGQCGTVMRRASFVAAQVMPRPAAHSVLTVSFPAVKRTMPIGKRSGKAMLATDIEHVARAERAAELTAWSQRPGTSSSRTGSSGSCHPPFKPGIPVGLSHRGRRKNRSARRTEHGTLEAEYTSPAAPDPSPWWPDHQPACDKAEGRPCAPGPRPPLPESHDHHPHRPCARPPPLKISTFG